MKRLLVVAICVIAALGALWLFLKRPTDIEARFVGTWSGLDYPVPGRDYPVKLMVRADHTYTFGKVKGTWHIEGDELILEQRGQHNGDRLHIEPDHGSLTDGYIDGWIFHRVDTVKKSD